MTSSVDSAYSILIKRAGEEREPFPEDHPASPKQKLRPRAEVIIYNKDGIYGIKKEEGYLLIPGGGIPEGQRPDEAAIVEALEEADRLCHNVEDRGTVSTVYNKKYMKYKDWDGEVTHFFIALDGGPGNMNHVDREPYDIIPFEDAIMYLNDLMNVRQNEWAHHNNYTRMKIIQEASRRATMDNNGLIPVKYAYWREDLPRYIKRTGVYKGLASYIEALGGKNIIKAVESENAIAALKEKTRILYEKELNKGFKGSTGAKMKKLEASKAAPPRGGVLGFFDKKYKKTPSVIDDKLQLMATQSDAVNQGRLKKLQEIGAKLKKAKPMSVVGEQMRTNDARILTGAAVVGGGIVGGNYLVGKAKNKPFTSNGPGYMMPPGYRDQISMPDEMRMAADKTAMSRTRILEAIYKRNQSTVAAKDPELAHKTTAQLMRMFPGMEKRLGFDETLQTARSTSKYLSKVGSQSFTLSTMFEKISATSPYVDPVANMSFNEGLVGTMRETLKKHPKKALLAGVGIIGTGTALTALHRRSKGDTTNGQS